MGKRQLPPEEPAEIHEVMLRDALEERYLAYALSTIMHRALPDARDAASSTACGCCGSIQVRRLRNPPRSSAK
jgi:hypothetical protein